MLRSILPPMGFTLMVRLVADSKIFGERVTLSFNVIGVTLAVFLAFATT